MAHGEDPAVEVTAVTAVDEELVAALGRLLPQLSPSAPVPTLAAVRDVVAAPGTTLLIARDPQEGGRIVGILTLVVFRTPTGVRAWIEDVVVDETARGRGTGEALGRAAIHHGIARGARTIELTSRPSREAANRLYERLGFRRRDTNVYRYAP